MSGRVARLEVEAVGGGALGAAERDAWRAFQGANPALAHPYFDPRYAEVAADTAPGGRIAVLRRGGRVVGFLPFQRRGRLIQPLAAPLSDYHGLIADPSADIDLVEVVRGLGGGRFRFSGLADVGVPAGAPLIARRRMVADLRGGPDAVQADWDARDPRFAKNLRRLERALARDHGEAEFVWNARDERVLDWIVGLKREQYACTRLHDVFACGWTVRLLRRLMAIEDADFGVRLAWMHIDGRLVAAEAMLVGLGGCHMWFPAYDRAFRRCGPGIQLSARELRAAAAAGLAWADFGCGEESYKSYFTAPAGQVFEGVLSASPLDAGVRRVARAVIDHAPRPVRSLSLSLGRRVDIINACETEIGAWLGGAAQAARAALAKAVPPRRTASGAPA